MEPVNPLFPALRSGTPSLLRRAGGLIDAVQSIQREASAEYWYNLAMQLSDDNENRLAYFAKSEELLCYEVATILRALENENDERYNGIDSDGESWGYYFESEAFYIDNQVVFANLQKCYALLVDLSQSSAAKADRWIELAELIKPYDLPHLASIYYRNSFVCENRLKTILDERRLSGSFWCETWVNHIDERILSNEQIIAKFPEYPDSYFSRSRKNSLEGRYEIAMDDLNLYVSKAGNMDAEFYKLRCFLHHQLGDTSAARQDAANVSRLGGRLLDFIDGDWVNQYDAPL